MTKELAIAKKTLPIVEEAKKLSISNDKDMAKATEVLSKLNKANDAVLEDKDKLMRPALDTVNEIRSRYKPLESTLKEGIDYIRGIMTKFRTEQKRIADEEAARIEARVGKGKGKLKADTAIAKMAEIEQPDESIIADSGMVKFRTVELFELEDARKVPVEYLILDEVKVRAAMKDGKKLPGIRYFTEERPVNSR